nr:unnamed protein product [Spirometra erinaceieuropaei]
MRSRRLSAPKSANLDYSFPQGLSDGKLPRKEDDSSRLQTDPNQSDDSGSFWTLICFVGFCYLANHWQRAEPPSDALVVLNLDNVRAAIAFTFFSILSWAGLTYAAFMRYRATVQYGVYADDVIRPGGGGSAGVVGGDHAGYHDPTAYPDTFEAPPYDSAAGKYYDESQFVSGRNANDTDILAS